VTSKTFVLVHGAWHGGWCWNKVASVLRGHSVLTPTQTGLGDAESPDKWAPGEAGMPSSFAVTSAKVFSHCEAFLEFRGRAPFTGH